MISLPFVGLIAGIVLIIYSAKKFFFFFGDWRRHPNGFSKNSILLVGKQASDKFVEGTYPSAGFYFVLLIIGIAIAIASSLVLFT